MRKLLLLTSNTKILDHGYVRAINTTGNIIALHLPPSTKPVPTIHRMEAFMTLHKAKAKLREGAQLGDVYPLLEGPDAAATARDRLELKRFFCYDLPPRSVVRAQQTAPQKRRREDMEHTPYHKQTTTSLHSIAGTTGEICPRCQGCNVKKTGTCSVCMDCGESVGGCS